MGRPTKKPKAGERIPLGLRVTAAVKHRLDKAAKASGRSQSQEAEIRLEQSCIEFDDPELRSMAHSCAWAFKQRLDLEWDSHPEEKDKRRTDPTTLTYLQGVVAVVQSLITDMPLERRVELFEAIRMAMADARDVGAG